MDRITYLRAISNVYLFTRTWPFWSCFGQDIVKNGYQSIYLFHLDVANWQSIHIIMKLLIFNSKRLNLNLEIFTTILIIYHTYKLQHPYNSKDFQQKRFELLLFYIETTKISRMAAQKMTLFQSSIQIQRDKTGSSLH